MGCFSWMFADTDNQKRLVMEKPACIICPDNSIIVEREYEGYGVFGGQDIYDLVADWNREYLSQHPEFVVKQHGSVQGDDGKLLPFPDKRVDEFSWYPLFADLSKTPAEITEEMQKQEPYWEYRHIGIELACYDDQNAALPFPIKVCLKPYYKYEDLPASECDPDQGFESDDDEDDDSEW